MMAHSLCSLPPELIEEIIISSALLGDTRLAASLARTCRFFRALIYHQFHKHLWREMFLVVFDNPHPAGDVRTHGRAPQSHSYLANKGKFKSYLSIDTFPWEDEYKRRIWTESFILRRTHSPPDYPSFDISPDLPSNNKELRTVLETLLRVVLTAAPLPYDALASIMSHHHPYGPSHPHPIFSPLFVVANTQPTLALGSRNTTWLTRVLAHGLPSAFMARLIAFDEKGEVDVQKRPLEWDGLLAKLVAQIGLMMPINSGCSVRQPHHTVLVSPFPTIPEDSEGNGGDTNAHASSAMSTTDLSESDDESESEIDGDEVLGAIATPATISLDGVRRLARVRVYNMAYLHTSRSFGPFLPLDALHSPGHLKPDSAACNCSKVEEEGEEDAWFSLTAVPPVPPIPDTNSFLSALLGTDGSNNSDDSDDSEDENVDSPPEYTSHPYAVGDDAEGEEEEEEEEEGEDASLSHSNLEQEESSSASASVPPPPAATSNTRRSHLIETRGDQLHFDWAWIAAARLVIELNLWDLLMIRHQGVLRALLSLEGLRPFSAPGCPPAAHEVEDEDAEGDRRDFKEGEGWDWAGVEGQWRRCVCWLDYRDLLGNNAQPLSRRFSNPALYEVMRIIPLTLRITHYTRAPPAWPGRPTIHVSGNWHTSTSPPELARVRGTVEMTASGDVRWTLVSFREDGEGEWASEGVQLGGRGSAMGVIGMWTGAEHEPSDPLGPFWAWKVGPLGSNAVANDKSSVGSGADTRAS
ncbi:hypothetical protein B0F90DRAFT_1927184 [Multifurca ochricompacta]|uniref:F-box domain-containing protein n=1 Tax=Multifurca ochricompacta TaxID=376703 RepID=A0AAD4LZI3_9AGAM|nr:hypothetical protein B0F90DRAFT_1927184 [Multifurca ochricompacta]